MNLKKTNEIIVKSILSVQEKELQEIYKPPSPAALRMGYKVPSPSKFGFEPDKPEKAFKKKGRKSKKDRRKEDEKVVKTGSRVLDKAIQYTIKNTSYMVLADKSGDFTGVLDLEQFNIDDEMLAKELHKVGAIKVPAKEQWVYQSGGLTIHFNKLKRSDNWGINAIVEPQDVSEKKTKKKPKRYYVFEIERYKGRDGRKKIVSFEKGLKWVNQALQKDLGKNYIHKIQYRTFVNDEKEGIFPEKFWKDDHDIWFYVDPITREHKMLRTWSEEDVKSKSKKHYVFEMERYGDRNLRKKIVKFEKGLEWAKNLIKKDMVKNRIKVIQYRVFENGEEKGIFPKRFNRDSDDNWYYEDPITKNFKMLFVWSKG